MRKYTPSGELAWMREASVNTDYPWFNHRVVTDSAGNCIVGGMFYYRRDGSFEPGEITFADVTLTTIGFQDGFVAKYSPAGDFVWAVQSQGQSPVYWGYQIPNDISGVSGFLITPTPAGDILFIGSLTGPVAFGELVLEGPAQEFWWRQPAFAGRLVDKAETVSALYISRQTNEVVLSWPATDTGGVLESTPTLLSPTWTAVADKPAVDNGQSTLRVGTDGATRFFRLRRP